jgi:hypothetical protein
MTINNREDANRYYQIINDLVDDYVDKWKIRPSKLKKYLKPGSQRFKNFLERNKLSEIQGSDRILKDIIDDRYHMEKDGVLSFESFKYFESNEFKIQSLKQSLYKGIEKSNINMEKILADYFDTNLGDIDIIDSDKHIFKLNDWNNSDYEVIIYSKDEINVITDNIIEHLYSELSNKKIELTEHISIELSDLINKELFTSKIGKVLTEDLIKKLISDALGGDFKFKDEFKEHYIWIS